MRLAARALSATTYDQLVSGVNPADLAKADVYPLAGAYPLGWDEPGALAWGRHWYDGLTQFFEADAAADDAVLVWLD